MDGKDARGISEDRQSAIIGRRLSDAHGRAFGQAGRGDCVGVRLHRTQRTPCSSARSRLGNSVAPRCGSRAHLVAAAAAWRGTCEPMRHKKDCRLGRALAQSVQQNEVIATVSGRLPDGPGNARGEMCQLQSQAGHGGLPATEYQVPALRDAEFIEGRSEPPIRVPSSAFLSSRKVIDMTIHATTIVPIGTEYVASASGIQIPQGASYGQIQRPGKIYFLMKNDDVKAFSTDLLDLSAEEVSSKINNIIAS